MEFVFLILGVLMIASFLFALRIPAFKHWFKSLKLTELEKSEQKNFHHRDTRIQ